MKTLLVTSRVTFIPENYGRFVIGMAANRHISAVLFLENRDLKTLLLGAAMWSSRLAPGIGAALLNNSIKSYRDPREVPYVAAGKDVYSLSDINSPEAAKILSQFDLVVNARTRSIYRDAALQAPRLGCINIHHGLLPEQRGLFCDLWALAEGRAPGFTIHKMTPRLDDGEILERVEVKSTGSGIFLDHAYQSSIEELTAMGRVLDRIENADRIEGVPNTRSPDTKYFNNPSRIQIQAFKKLGIRL